MSQIVKTQSREEESKMGGANIAGLATPPRRIPAGIIPSYMAVFEFSKLKRLILSGKDVKIRQNCKKGAIYTFLLLFFHNYIGMKSILMQKLNFSTYKISRKYAGA